MGRRGPLLYTKITKKMENKGRVFRPHVKKIELRFCMESSFGLSFKNAKLIYSTHPLPPSPCKLIFSPYIAMKMII